MTSVSIQTAAQRAARNTVLGLVGLLAVVLLAWQWHDHSRYWWLALLWIAPLILPLRGLLRGQRYTFAWATLLTIPYMALGVTEVIAAPSERVLPAIVCLTAFGWLIALVAFLRLTREAKQD